MNKAVHDLPESYREILSVDMDGDKKLMLIVNGLAMAIAVIMAIGMAFVVPISSLFSGNPEEWMYFVKLAVMCVGVLAYIVLHEGVHGVAMKHYGCRNVHFGFKGAYAFAATDSYIPRRPYVVIALAPIVVWGIVLAVVSLLVPRDWFWIVYFIQIMNISGAAGDLYISFRLKKLPQDILVRDEGVRMTVYSGKQG